jgi:hypothetical protein
MCAQRVLGSAAPIDCDSLGRRWGGGEGVNEADDGEDERDAGEDEEEPPGGERGGRAGMVMEVRFETLGFVFVVVVRGSVVIGKLVRPHLGKRDLISG